MNPYLRRSFNEGQPATAGNKRANSCFSMLIRPAIVFAFLFCFNAGKAQTTLSAGDIAIVGYNADGPIDNFSFILLTNVSAGTSVNFTDFGWCTDGSGFQKGNPVGCTGGSGSYGAKTDGAITWTSSTALACGTEIWVQCQNSLSASSGTVTGLQATVNVPTDYISLAVGGDHLFAFQGTLVSPSFITGMSMNTGPSGGWDPVVNACDFSSLLSALPAALNSSNSFILTPEVDNAKYNCTVTSNSPANLRTAIFNSANWTVDDVTPVSLPLNCSFSCNSCIAPSVIGHQPNRTLCVGGNTTLPITATGTGLTYQWQVNTGSGFTNVPNAAPYSNITSATLTITSVTGSMSGYTYRCVVTGSCGTANSNSSTLTVDVVAGTSAVSPVSCFGGANGAAAVTVTSGIGPFSYSWSPSGGTSSTASGLSQGTYTCTITDNLTCTGTVSAVIVQPVAAVSASISTINNVTCPGGSNGNATVTPSGGTPGYTYLWSNGATTATIFGALAGTYSVTVRDSKNCPASSSATISQPAAFVTSSSTTPVSCNGGTNGTATVTVSSGGQAPYTYQWSAAAGSQTTQTATGLSAGSYSCTITDANLCSTTVTGIVVGQPAVLNANTGFSNVSCNGGSNGTATVVPTGGNGGYTYLWSNGYTGMTATGLPAGPVSCTVTDSKGCTVTKNFTINQPAAFSISTSQTNILCNGGTGSAGVTVSGGTFPYNYSWSPSGGTGATATGLIAGTYTVTIEDDNTCSTTRTFTITQPAALTGAISKTDVSCNGGSNGTATVAITGGTGSYSYSWSPSGGTGATASGLATGTYTCTITDANNCQITRTATVGQPSAIVSGSTVVTNIACFGGSNGSINLTPTGGTGPYTFNWGGGITTEDRTGLAAGSYSVTITDANSCTGTVNVTVTQPSAAVSGSTVVTNISCFGGSNGSINLTPTGGTGPYTFNWGGGITTEDRTGLVAGSYSVTITDANSCTGTVNVTATQPSALVATAASQTNISCKGGSNGSATVSVTGGTPGYTYSWSPSGGTAATASGRAAGTYTVTVTDANGCTATQGFTITEPTAALTATAAAQTNVSCNGSSNGSATVSVTGGTGSYTYSWSPSGGTAATATGLVAGTYTVTATDANSCTTTQSFTITQPSSAVAGSTVVTNVSCFAGTNGSINLTPTGGTGPYTFNWGAGITTEDRTGLAAGSYSVTITDANSCTGTVNVTVTQPSAAVSGSTVVTNVSCFGGTNGSINLTPTGGTGPYIFNWGGGITTEDRTGLAAGSYSVTITDFNGCTSTVNATISQPTALVATAGSQTNVSCNGGSNGSASVSVTGGTAGYTYSWSPSGGTAATASGLAAGTYTVTVTDANSCTTTQTFTITQPTAFVATAASQTNVNCNSGSNGSATVSATGGTPGYTYSWSPSGGTAATATGLAAGTYTVTVTDANSCTTTQSFTITQPTALVATAGSQTNVICNGGSNGSATVSVTGGTAGYTYSWSPSGGTGATASGLVAGTYTVTVTDANSCTATQSFTITQPTALVATAASQTNVSCNSGSNGSATVSATGGTGSYTYSWSPSGGTAATASGLVAGTYTVTVTDANSCTTTQSFTITQPTALVANAAAQTNVSCNGGSNGSATVSVTGGTAGYTYSWSPSGGTGATASGLIAGTYTVTVTDANGCTSTRSFAITQPAALVAAAGSQTNIACNGGSTGSATVNVTGGTGSYTYSWSPSGGTAATASDLVAGTYTVTVTDANSCTTTQSFTITQPTTLVATPASQTNVSCNGGSNGSATVSVTGGTAGYTYSWSPSGGTGATASGLIAGTYTVTVTDANGCTKTQSFTITQPTALVATPASQTNVSCNGGSNGSATVSVTGGTAGYTYSWSPTGGTAATATGLTAGTYTVTVTDANSCTKTQSFTITQPTALVATAAAQTNVSCNGGNTGSATVNVTGGTGSYTYVWSPMGGTGATASGLAAGTYTVTVTDANGCTATQNFTITQPTVLVATAAAQTNVSCNGGSNGSATVSVTGGTSGYTYSWSPSGGTTATATGLTAGTYTVTVTDANSCATTQSFTITQPTALIATAASQTNVSCNAGSNGSATVSVTGGTGSYTYVWSPMGGTGATASGLAAGTYTVTVTDANSCTTTQGFTITEPAALIAAAGSQTNVSCNSGSNGSATVSVTGGIGSYAYVWSPMGGTAATATGLSAGTYTVTVTDDNSCTTTQSFTITEPTAISISTIASNSPVCSGGAIELTSAAAGGTGNLAYSWTGPDGFSSNEQNPSIDNATADAGGEYILTVTDENNCSNTSSVTVLIKPTPTITCPANIIVDATTGICEAVVNYPAATATGEPMPVLVYSIPSGSVFPVGVTTVTVTATNDCGIVTCTFTVTVNDTQVPVFTSQPTDTTVCTGSVAVFNAAVTNTVNYQWQLFSNSEWNDIPGANSASYSIMNTPTGLDGSKYRLIATSQCGTAVESNEVVLGVNALPVVSIAALLKELKPAESTTITATVNTPGGTYAWYKNDAILPTSNVSLLPNIGAEAVGEYKFSYVDVNGCLSVSDSVVITVNGDRKDFIVYPNPSQGQFTVRANTVRSLSPLSVLVYDSKGNVVYQKKAWTIQPFEKIEGNLNTAVSGTYTVSVTDVKGNLIGVKRIVVIR